MWLCPGMDTLNKRHMNVFVWGWAFVHFVLSIWQILLLLILQFSVEAPPPPGSLP